jgi:hypothetical protein
MGYTSSRHEIRFRIPELHGKTVRRFRIITHIDCRTIEIDFYDDTLLTLKLELVDSAELGTTATGNLTDIHTLKVVCVIYSAADSMKLNIFGM